MSLLNSYIHLMRPLHWLKNGFVFTGLIFSESYRNPLLLRDSFLTFVAFCLISSSIYIINDIFDREKDRQHPRKKNRPVASGIISPKAAGLLSITLCLASFVIGYFVSLQVFIILLIYYFLNIAYSITLKHIVILDAFCISAGFMLRILAGTIGIGIQPSKWLLFCGLMITLFIAFTKRRAEIIGVPNHSESQREVLLHYSSRLLDNMITICASCVIISYSLYTMSPDTIQIHQTENLIYTVPFVIYALFRYLYILYHHHSGEDPSRDIFKDRHILTSILCWAIITIYLFQK